MPFQPEPFGRFDLIRRLSAGGMGEVYLARLHGPAGFEKLLVIKRILDDLSSEREFVEMFFSEARLAAKLAHKNIVQIYEMGRVSGSYFIAMEYVQGISLRDLIHRQKEIGRSIPLAQFIEIGGQICDGLAYAHELSDAKGALNLVHRDVSPRNIMVSFAGDAKLIDFGIAKSRMQLETTQAGVIKGKLAYMSPEQTTARPLDKRSDIFALGVCLYELCTWRRPFDASGRALVIDHIQRKPATPLADIKPEYALLDPIIAKALAKSPDDRYPDCREMAKDMRKLLLSGQVEVPEGSLSDLLDLMFASERADHEKLLASITQPEAAERGSGQWSEESMLQAPELAAGFAPDPESPPGSGSLAREPTPGAAHYTPGLRARSLAPLIVIFLISTIGWPQLFGLGRRLGDRLTRTAEGSETEPVPPPLVEFAHPEGRRTEPTEPAVPPLLVPTQEEPTPAPPAPAAPNREGKNGQEPAAKPEPPPSAGTATPPTTAKRDPPPEQTTPDKRGPAPKGQHGRLKIKTTPKCPVLLNGRKIGGSVRLSSQSGTLKVCNGTDPTRDPFEITIKFRRKGPTVIYRLESEPWAIVQDEKMSGYGKTPLPLRMNTGAVMLHFKNPPQGRTLTVELELE